MLVCFVSSEAFRWSYISKFSTSWGKSALRAASRCLSQELHFRYWALSLKRNEMVCFQIKASWREISQSAAPAESTTQAKVREHENRWKTGMFGNCYGSGRYTVSWRSFVYSDMRKGRTRDASGGGTRGEPDGLFWFLLGFVLFCFFYQYLISTDGNQRLTVLPLTELIYSNLSNQLNNMLLFSVSWPVVHYLLHLSCVSASKSVQTYKLPLKLLVLKLDTNHYI